MTRLPPSGILIAGAGPTGMALALALAKSGVGVRLIDAAAGPGRQSRAMAVHARTLEFYRQFGFADEVVSAGVIVRHAHLREARKDAPGHEVAGLSFEDMDAGTTPYPFVLAYPQDDHERLLAGKLAGLGVGIEWNTRLTGFEAGPGFIMARVETEGRSEDVRADWLCGCDGAHSAVRAGLGTGFPGGTYEQTFFVADVKIAGGFQRDLVMNLGPKSLVLMLPVRSSGMQRLIGLVPDRLADRQDIDFEALRAEVEGLLDIRVAEVNWFSRYSVHHRVAEHFRQGRAFLLGDAAHIHSPVGAQGMNTGIGDAINLGWKLAQIVRNGMAGREADALLDSYEAERIGFARQLVKTTDRAFTPVIDEGLGGEAMRRVVMPALMELVSAVAPLRHTAFRTLSQTAIAYPDSPLSDGKAGHIQGGDRLPWTGQDGPDNYAPLDFTWQVHVHGGFDDDLAAVAACCERRGLPLHRFDWSAAADKRGYRSGAVYLVRPDGHVALALDTGDAGRLEAFARKWASA